MTGAASPIKTQGPTITLPPIRVKAPATEKMGPPRPAELGAVPPPAIKSGNDVPKAKVRQYAVPAGKEESIYGKLTDLFEDLFGRVLTSTKRAGIKQLIRSSMREDGTIVINRAFRARLAQVTGRRPRSITPQALDAMWGNGDGVLNEEDSYADLAEFTRRTEELVPIFAVKSEAGESVYDFMRSSNIIFIPDRTAGRIFKKTTDFAELNKSKDRLFSACLSYASRGYLRSLSKIKGEEAARDAQKELERIIKDNDWKSMSDEFATLLFVAYKTTFDFQLKDKDIDFDTDLDLRNPEIFAHFMRGVFKDYVENRSIDLQKINLKTLLAASKKAQDTSRTLTGQKATPEA